MPTRERQSSFAAGEFSPSLTGRTDFAKYGSGCATALNYFVTPFGTLKNRPGTEVVQAFPEEADSNHNTGRLVPFVFSDTETVLMVFRHEAIRFFKYNSTSGKVQPLSLDGADTYVYIRGAFVRLSVPGSFVLDSPYQCDELFDLRFCQVGDVVTIVHKNHAPRELKRLSSDSSSWSLLPIDFETPAFPVLGDDDYFGTPYLDYGVRDKYVGSRPYVPSTDTDAAEVGLPEPTDTYPAREWQWAVTRVIKDADGKVYETRPRVVTQGREKRALLYTSARVYQDQTYVYFVNSFGNTSIYQNLTGSAIHNQHPEDTTVWTYVGDATLDDATYRPLFEKLYAVDDKVAVYPVPAHYITVDWSRWSLLDSFVEPEVELLETRVYRGRTGNYGYIGSTFGSDDGFFIDTGEDPDFSVAPPSTDPSPFYVDDADYPSVVTMYEGRRVFGATPTYPSQVWASAIEQYANIDVKDVALDTDALNFELSTPKYEQIRAMIPRKQLIVLTDNSEWLVAGSGEMQLLTPSSIAARPMSQFGSGNLFPLDVNGLTLFMQRKGTVPRGIGLHQSGGYQAFDISAISRHLFTGHTIKDWAFAEDPNSLVWAVRDDGDLLSCTLLPEQEMVAWTRHEVADATVLSVASVPEGTEDAVYLLVLRNDQVMLERMASRVITDVKDAVFLDASWLYDGRNTDTTKTATLDEGTGTEYRDTVTMTIPDTEAPNGSEFQVGDIIRVHVGEKSTTVEVVSKDGVNTYTATILDNLWTEVDGVASSVWALCTRQADVGYLGGEEVYALVNGAIAGPWTVDSESIDLASGDPALAAEVACVGLAYNSDFLSLNAPQEKGRRRQVRAGTIEIDGAFGGSAGRDLDNLEEIHTRKVEDSFGPVDLSTQQHRLPLSGRWNDAGTIAYRHSDPVPAEILGITRELEYGE